MCWLPRLLFLYAFAGAVLAQQVEQETILTSRPARVRGRTHDQPPKNDEPTCEELKLMWRYSKRQARAPELMNEVSSYRDPLMYNEWPVYPAMARLPTRYRYPYPNQDGRRENGAFGRIVTKAPPNAVRTPDYKVMFGMLDVPETAGKVLRFPGPSGRARPVFMAPPQRGSFKVLKDMIKLERDRELKRKYESEQKHGLKSAVAGHNNNGLEYPNYEQDSGYQQMAPDYGMPEPNEKHYLKPPSHQVSQYIRYSDGHPLSRRDIYRPMYYGPPDYAPYAY